ncbi:ArsR/SmtB family transcription factor [Kineococcus sp. NUM-3379]
MRLDLGPPPASVPDTGELLHVVADPVRWRILGLLAGEQLCTTHLQDLLGAKQTLVSHHLKVLRDAGLVDTEPCGRFTYYRLRPGALDGLAAATARLAGASHGDVDRRAC